MEQRIRYPDTNPIGDRYGTQAPLRFGDYIAKFDIVPGSSNFRALTDQKLDESKSPDSIREELMAIFANEGGTWTLRVQLCRDLEKSRSRTPRRLGRSRAIPTSRSRASR